MADKQLFFCVESAFQPSAKPDDLLLFLYGVGLLLTDQLQRLDDIEAAVSVLPHPDLALQPAMFLTVGQAQIISRSAGEPADLFAGIFSAAVAAGGGYHTVLHGIGLAAEGF